MSRNHKTAKYGNYIQKVGYLDIRKKVEYRKITNFRENKHPQIESHEYIIYHGKHSLEGGFKGDKMDAVKRAQELVEQGVIYIR